MKTIFTVLLAAIVGLVQAQGYKMEGNQLVTETAVVFKTGSAELLPESETALQAVKSFLEAKKYITTLRIEGHLAAGGAESSLQTLSEQRAMAIARWLKDHGIACGRLLPVGFGITKPVEANDGPSRALNNRVEFRMAALNGKAIGSMPLDGGGKVAGNVCE